MQYHFIDSTPRDIATITRESNRREDGKARATWRKIIASKEMLSKLDLESAEAISALEFNLTYWIKESRNMTVQVLFEKILTRGGVLTYIMNSPEKFWLMQVLSTFFDFIK